MTTLKEWRDGAHKFTAKLSDINRNLAFAGIAIIWIFKIQINEKYIIPDNLLLPLYLIIICLMLDILQYLFQSIIWTLFHRRKENEGIVEDEHIEAPKWYSNVSYVFLFSKVAVNITGFIILFIHLSKALFI
jgi:hypothetical protein